MRCEDRGDGCYRAKAWVTLAGGGWRVRGWMICSNGSSATGSLVQRRVGEEGRAGELGMARFLESPAVTKEEIAETIAERTGRGSWGGALWWRRGDGGELCRRRSRAVGSGSSGSVGESAGFLIHAAVAVEVESAAVLGLADATIWKRCGRVKVLRRSARLDGEGVAPLRLTTTRIVADLLGMPSR